MFIKQPESSKLKVKNTYFVSQLIPCMGLRQTSKCDEILMHSFHQELSGFMYLPQDEWEQLM